MGTAGHIVHDCVPAGKESKRGDRGGVPGSSAGGRRGPVVPGIFPGGTSVVSTAATRVCLARTDRAPGCRIRRGEGESAAGAGPGFKIWVFNFLKDDVFLQPKLYIHNT